jgi:hypothetical protein
MIIYPTSKINCPPYLTTSLDTAWYDFINVVLPLWFCQTFELLIYLPLVEQVPQRHEPDLRLRPMKQSHTVKNQPGKQLIIAYPTCAFFEGSSSDSILRFVPLNIASMMLFL